MILVQCFMMIDVWIGKGIGGEGCVIHRERRYSPGEWDLAPVGDQTLIPPPPCNMGVNVDLDQIFCDDYFMEVLRGLGLRDA